ncbi:glycosyltransferase family 2 protein [Iningainema tapete]|uniref:Glycosyltransferase family 2 protein n=1 Tax=Iningainema tapete BLCC-T55 TaxID=2748662 RepID=A0A8J7BY10_9CYAN|nr:glycosyltransferase family 2 protein [Iningainema tapete]MBD2774797.1 glycosyltransferase family 2 protein [Iningainema tapete BLCC-T55]
MKFSVVITTYNRLTLLQRAIDSALNQTIPCEVIVADDCSSDNTQDYVNKLKSKLGELGSRLVYHCNEVNKGHAATVNAGVNKASGDWIKFLDDDDYLSLNCLEEMVRAIALRKEAVICSCIAAQVNEQEVELSRTPQLGSGLAFYIPQSDIHYGMLLELLPLGTPVQVACRRDAFLKSGGWDSKLDANCDDIDSWIRITQYGDALILNQCLAYRTIWTGAYNQKFSLLQRLDTNMLMKEKIYALVDKQHQKNIPALQDIKNYLKLHWAIVALKQRKINSFLNMVDAKVLSLKAWQLLLSAAFARRFNLSDSHIRKFVLIE